MNRFQLTLDEYEPVVFSADVQHLKARLNAAYLSFTAQHNVSQALLYVHHSTHGWCQVCRPDGVYPIINNPLTLNAQVLASSVSHTLTLADQYFTEQQKQDRQASAQQTQRCIDAKIQRSRFHIIDKND